MNITEGSRRLSLVLTWAISICIWIPGAIAFIILGIKHGGNVIEVLPGLVLVLIVGFVIRDICLKVGLWILKGFARDKNVAGDNSN
ncbi:MAG: hypothetical protein FVQ82_09770 [Planctomycetes bacterium]|nr:hypothetical protein [Planctomycetota bacterium]